MKSLEVPLANKPLVSFMCGTLVLPLLETCDMLHMAFSLFRRRSSSHSPISSGTLKIVTAEIAVSELHNYDHVGLIADLAQVAK